MLTSPFLFVPCAGGPEVKVKHAVRLKKSWCHQISSNIRFTSVHISAFKLLLVPRLCTVPDINPFVRPRHFVLLSYSLWVMKTPFKALGKVHWECVADGVRSLVFLTHIFKLLWVLRGLMYLHCLNDRWKISLIHRFSLFLTFLNYF